MKLSHTNNTPFTSKIVCLSPQDFQNIIYKLPSDSENIINWDIEPTPLITGEKRNYNHDKSPFGYRHDIQNGYTFHIKSCTGGVIVDKKRKQAALFSHLKNSPDNIINIPNLDTYIHGTNAIFVGGKSRFDYSMELINSIIHTAKRENLPTTYMKGLNFYHEINMAYSGLKDTLYICIKNIHTKEHVKSMDDLKKVFNKVFISSADTIEFGKKDSLSKNSLSSLISNFSRTFKRIKKSIL